MDLKAVVESGMPQYMVGKYGFASSYAIAEKIGKRPQTIYEWYRKSRIDLECVNLLMGIRGHKFRLDDFYPFCAELRTVQNLMFRWGFDPKQADENMRIATDKDGKKLHAQKPDDPNYEY